MAHFAKISNKIVESINVVSDNDCGSDFPASESVGQAFIASLGLSGEWKQTSYNNNFRKQFARVGYTYDADADQFVSLSPFPSWTLDSNNDWQAPKPKPEGNYYWNEESLSWLATPSG
jgi:hypothetical protein